MELKFGVEIGIGDKVDLVEPRVHVALRRRQSDDRRFATFFLFGLKFKPLCFKMYYYHEMKFQHENFRPG